MLAVLCFSWCAPYHPSPTHKHGHVQADQLILAPPSTPSLQLFVATLLLRGVHPHIDVRQDALTEIWRTLTIMRKLINQLPPLQHPPMAGAAAPFVCIAPMRVAPALTIPQFAAPTDKISATCSA